MVTNNHGFLKAKWHLEKSFSGPNKQEKQVRKFYIDTQWLISDQKALDKICIIIYQRGLICDNCNKWDKNTSTHKI